MQGRRRGWTGSDDLLAVGPCQGDHQRVRRDERGADFARMGFREVGGETRGDLRGGRGVAGPGEAGQCVAKLLRRKPAHGWAAEHKILLLLLFPDIDRRQLVGARGQDLPDQVLHVVAVRGKILGQPIQQVWIPCHFLHVVHRFNESAAHKPLPEAVDQSAREPRVLPLGYKRGQLVESGRFIRRGVNGAQLWVEEFQRGLLAGRLVAMDHFQRTVRVDAGQAIRIGQRQVVDKAVVAGSALEVHAHKDLGDILRGLHLRCLTCINNAPPDDALGEPLGLGCRVDQLSHELVVGHVGEQSRVEPMGDLLAPPIDVAGAFVIIAQQVIPEAEPMLGVIAIVSEQPLRQPFLLVAVPVGNERLQFLRRRQQSDHIQVCAPREQAIADGAWRLDVMRREIRFQEAVDWIGGFGPGRNCRQMRFEIDRFNTAEGHLRIPRCALVDPGAEHADLFGRQARALARHNVVGVNSLHQGDDQTLGALAGEDRWPAIAPFEGGLPGIHAEPALVLAPAMAIDAACFEDGFDFLGETNRMTRRRRQLRRLLRRDRDLGSATTT